MPLFPTHPTVLPLLLVAPLTAQRNAPSALDDHLVRQVVERERVSLPRASTGTPINAEGGPRGLLVWRDGELPRAVALPRAERPRAADVAPPTPPELGSAVVEEIELEAEAGAEAEPEDPATPTSATTTAGLVAIELLTAEDGPAIRIARSPPQSLANREHAIDALQLARGDREATALLTPTAEAPLQAIVDALDALHAAGFSMIAFGGIHGDRLTGVEQHAIQSAPEALGFRREPPTAPGMPGIIDGEMLLLLDADRPWQRVGRMYEALALAGVWRIALVVEDRDGARRRLPIPIPTDPATR